MKYEKYMKIAISMAKRAEGITSDNPNVGAVIVKNGKIISSAHTAQGGRPHAETIAIHNAIESVRGATIYVTLEPCSHQGKTPPCVDAIISSGIKRVVIGSTDINPLVSGEGISKLEKAGIEVVKGVLSNETDKINAAFFKRIKTKKPFITLKIAASLDGKIANKNGKPAAITNKFSRKYAHYLRYRNDGILVGVNTILNDNPLLNCRMEGLEDFSPARFVLDSLLRTPKNSNLIETANKIPTYILSDSLEKNLGEAKIIKIEKLETGLNLNQALEEIAKCGVNRLLVEGGGKVARSFLDENLVDRVEWFISPKTLGVSAIPALGTKFNFHTNFDLTERKYFDEDTLLIFEKKI
jgi:diaminohydroxyphosphoribosylaminopyrimidine deaminase/5-amino-6-(5-phosphoribosylamino)uracil reductase